MKNLNNFTSLRHASRQLGQAMTEYIIIVMLIGIGSIFVYTQFGDVLRNQMAAAAKTLAGQDGSVQTAAAQNAASAASTGTSRNLGNAAENPYPSGGGGGSPGDGAGTHGGGGDGGSPGDGTPGDGGGAPFGGGGGAFEPPPPGGGTTPGGSGAVGINPLETDGVMDLICLSKTFCDDVKKWASRSDVIFEYTTEGSRVEKKPVETCKTNPTTGKETCSSETKIFVYINNGAWNELEVVRHIAHEVGHLESTVYKPKAKDVSKEVFVQSRLEEEGAAVMYNIKVQREILVKGGEWKNIGVNCGMGDQTECFTRYESIYNDYAAGKISANTARKKIGDLRAVEATMSGPSYRKSLEDYWDSKNPSTP